MKSKKINSLRKKLDKIDDRLLSLIKIRTGIVNKVLETKKYKKDIIDRQRINNILARIKKKSKLKKIDPKITTKIWSAMIRAYIDFEYRNFK